MMMQILQFFLRRVGWALALCGFLSSAEVFAADAPPVAENEAASAWARNDQGAVRLVSAARTVGDARALTLGLEFRLQKGWKIYWRAPGDAGYPPRIETIGSANLAALEMRWPAPQRFAVLGLQTIGYKDAVILPLRVTLTEPGKALSLRAHVEYLVCDQICVPQQAALALDLPEGPAQASAFSHAIAQYDSRVPSDGRAHGLILREAGLTAQAGIAGFQAVVDADPPLVRPDLFIEGPRDAIFDPPRVALQDGGRRAALFAPLADAPRESLEGKPLIVTIVEDGRGLEAKVTAALSQANAQASAPSNPATEETSALWLMLSMMGIALVGGLILNLMPCVLPVLSIKLLGVVSHGGGERRHIRASFLASASGILVSFWILAAGTLALKTAGAAVGWGIQFQQPLFLVGLIALLTVFAANLWGFFEVLLPSALMDHMPHGSPRALAGHFLTGAFATLLATPCTAPFLGAAVGFALARGGAEIFAIFTMLGLGLALPYLLVALYPDLARRLPRPGPWMLTLKHVMGFALAGTAVWLLTVLAAQSGSKAASLTAGFMLLALALLFLRRRLLGGLRAAAAACAAFAILAAFTVPGRFPISEESSLRGVKKDAVAWQAFDQARIAALAAEGKTVLVDVTADWCLTCQVNKAAVLARGEVAKRLNETVIPMQADWTRPDARIAAYLASFGRYGIPFNAVYGPGAPGGIALPELLTADAVLAAIDQAGRKP